MILLYGCVHAQRFTEIEKFLKFFLSAGGIYQHIIEENERKMREFDKGKEGNEVTIEPVPKLNVRTSSIVFI